MTRKEVSEMIFNYIKSIGFKPTNIKYGNGYFIIDKGEDGVVHFNIKGLYGWKFAMWINTNKDELISEDGEEYNALQFFAQHKDNIDKFKPSRSCFLAEYTLREVENPYPYQWYKIKNMIKMIKRHPFISHYYDKCEYCEFTGKSFILEYLNTKIYNKKETIKDLIYQWIPIIWVKFKLLFLQHNNLIDNIKIVDRCKDGWITIPRWEVILTFTEDSTDEKECIFLDKWFKKTDYKQLRIELNRIGINSSYCYTDR